MESFLDKIKETNLDTLNPKLRTPIVCRVMAVRIFISSPTAWEPVVCIRFHVWALSRLTDYSLALRVRDECLGVWSRTGSLGV